MTRAVIAALLALLVPVAAQQQEDQPGNRSARKTTGHEFKFTASPQQCTDVLYTESATRIIKDAGGATPLTLRLAPKLYRFTCKCAGGDTTSGPVMVGDQQSYSFRCETPVVAQAPTPQSGRCDINRDDARNVNDHRRIGDQDVFHIRCTAPSQVLSAQYDTCTYAGGERCSSINARNELSGPCADDPKVACIYYQTNDGNFKVIHGSYTYMPH
jgi:hypothetical protein